MEPLPNSPLKMPEEEPQLNTAKINLLQPGATAESTQSAPQSATPLPPQPNLPPEPPPPSVPPPLPTREPAAAVTQIATAPRRSFKALIIATALIILALAGAGTYLWFINRSAEEVTVTPPPTSEAQPSKASVLKQSDTSGILTTGGATKEKKVTLSFVIPGSAGTGSFKPEVEVRPVGTAFTNQATSTGLEIEVKGSDITAQVTTEELADGAYHWQSRLVGSEGTGDWVVFGDNDEATADFAIDSVLPASPATATVDTQQVVPQVHYSGGSRPVFAGTAEAGTSVTVEIKPESLLFKGTTDTSGKWSITAISDIPNGSHTVSVTASDAAGNVSPASTFDLHLNQEAMGEMAPTGDNTILVSLIGLVVMILSLVAWLTMRRSGESKT